MVETLVTSYPTPDIDGVACSIAYAEYLNKNSQDAVGAVFGKPESEALELLERRGLSVQDAESFVDEITDVRLVDACNLSWISQQIEDDEVSEIIDHREDHFAESFPKANAQIELVGAAATLIAEKFYLNNIEISEDSAALLHTAIVDNSANFQAGITSEKDFKMAEYLEENGARPELSREIIEIKSDIEGSIEEEIKGDYYYIEHNQKRIGVSQIEGRDSIDKIEKRLNKALKTLENLKTKDNLDYLFLTVADLEKGSNLIVTEDKNSKEIVSKALDLDFEDSRAQTEDLLLRKEIIPKIKQSMG